MDNNKTYKQNFIDSFLLRFDFLDMQNKNDIEHLSKKLSQLYPMKETSITEITPDGGARQTFHRVVLHDKNNESQVHLGNNFFALSVSKYVSFEKIIETTQGILSAVDSVLGIKTFSRIGMRYRNIIKIPCKKRTELFDWIPYINETLLINKNMPYLKDNSPLRTRQIIVFEPAHNNANDSPNVIYTVQGGIENQGFPAPVMEKSFLIDIDGWVRSTTEREDVIEVINDIHNHEEEYFEQSIKDGLRSIMEGKKAA